MKMLFERSDLARGRAPRKPSSPAEHARREHKRSELHADLEALVDARIKVEPARLRAEIEAHTRATKTLNEQMLPLTRKMSSLENELRSTQNAIDDLALRIQVPASKASAATQALHLFDPEYTQHRNPGRYADRLALENEIRMRLGFQARALADTGFPFSLGATAS